MLLGRIAQLENRGLGELGMFFGRRSITTITTGKTHVNDIDVASYGPKTPFTAMGMYSMDEQIMRRTRYRVGYMHLYVAQRCSVAACWLLTAMFYRIMTTAQKPPGIGTSLADTVASGAHEVSSATNCASLSNATTPSTQLMVQGQVSTTARSSPASCSYPHNHFSIF